MVTKVRLLESNTLIRLVFPKPYQHLLSTTQYTQCSIPAKRPSFILIVCQLSSNLDPLLTSIRDCLLSFTTCHSLQYWITYDSMILKSNCTLCIVQIKHRWIQFLAILNNLGLSKSFRVTPNSSSYITKPSKLHYI